MKRNNNAAPAGLLVLGVLSACGGDGGGNAALVPTNESPGGIWSAPGSQTGPAVLALVAETGQFHFITGNGTQYVGTVATSVNSVSGSFDSFAPPGLTFMDGSTHGTGTVAGTIHQQSSFDATMQMRTDAGASYNDVLAMTFNALYNRSSSLATIAGTYTDAATATVFSVYSDGTIFAQDGDCVIHGTVSIIDARYNVYGVTVAYQKCLAQYSVPDGAQLTGLGTLDNTVSPERAIIGLSGTAGATNVALVETLHRT